MVSKTNQVKVNNGKPAASTSSATKPPAAAGNLDDLHAQAELAHKDYLQARMKVVAAYREKEQHDAEAYREVGLEAQKTCDTAIENALIKLEERVQQATEAYQKERAEAVEIYRQEIMKALSLSREATERAWSDSRKTSELIWKIFQGNGLQDNN
jgi:hypothetical protein